MSADELLIMTIKTETEKPELTYSRAKGLVELVTGIDIYFLFFEALFQVLSLLLFQYF